MKYFIIVFIICLICMISIMILYRNLKNLQNDIDNYKQIINKHILNDLTELPKDMSLNKLTVKDLEIDDKLKFPNNSLYSIEQINKSSIYSIDNINKVNITNDNDYIYGNNNGMLFTIGVLNEEKLNNVCKDINIYNDKGEIIGVSMEKQQTPCNINIKKIKLQPNDIIVISKKLSEHLQKGIDLINNKTEINENEYPNELIDKYKKGKYEIIEESIDNTNTIENFDNIPIFKLII